MMSNKSKKVTVRKLHHFLSDLDGFSKPKVKYEQYVTPPNIAASILNEIHSCYDDIDGKFIADLGCGPGILSIGSLYCGASMVFGFDIDRDSLDDALINYKQAFGSDDDDNEEDTPLKAYRACGKFNLINADLGSEEWNPFWNRWDFFDTVIMNPPFGTKDNEGIDIEFLKRGFDFLNSNGAVYSLHKTSTRKVTL